MFYIVCSDKILGGDIIDYDILTHKIKLDDQLNYWNITGIFGKYIVRQNGTNVEIYSNDDRDRRLTTLTNVDSKVVAITKTEQTIFVANETKVWVFDYNFENKDGPYEINTEIGDKIFDICTFDFGRRYVILTKYGYIGEILNNKIVYYYLFNEEKDQQFKECLESMSIEVRERKIDNEDWKSNYIAVAEDIRNCLLEE